MERIKLGLLGLNFGKHILTDHLLSGAGQPYFEVAGICSQIPEQVAASSKEYGVRGFTDLEAMLANPEIKAIGVFSGPIGRAALIRKCIEAGKDVITTKPFELDPDAAKAVLEHARALGRVVQLNSPAPLLSDDLRQVIRWQNEYQLGQPIACRADVWVRYREQADGSWYDDPALCPVAPIFRLGIYLINDLVRLFGEAAYVQVMQSRLFTGRPTADNAQLTIQFRRGAIATIFASFCIQDGDHYRNALTLNYERGTIYRAPTSSRKPGHCELRLVSTNEGKPFIETKELSSTSGQYQWKAFHQAIRGEHFPEQVSVEQIVQGVKIVRAMQRAQDSGQTEIV